MGKAEHRIGQLVVELVRLHKLRQVYRRKTEAYHVYAFGAVGATTRAVHFTMIAFYFFLFAVYIARQAKTQFEVVLFGVVFFVMVHHHAHIVHIPGRQLVITPDNILHRTGYLLLLFLQ